MRAYERWLKNSRPEALTVLQESGPSNTVVKKWARFFQQGRETCEDGHPGRSVTADNASVHTLFVARQALKDTGFGEIDYTPYSPDLAPSDYFLFSNLKKNYGARDLLMIMKCKLP
ncbi:hypothetical protein EVAR_60116_1 [Eumeta japonica]|uniref:Mariner Mos1 transposase n=1 Tax=Eumeta variegata TaxID=151549 RepID=A0A4C1ZZB7_EUMVA|nr:hypothetical protein EVAR_60116_1 [Eumeta japonica]